MNQAAETVTYRDKGAVEPPLRVAAVVPSGERQPRNTPQWLSHKKIVCPKCGRVEHGNVDPSKVAVCSLCLMTAAAKAERAGVTAVWRNPGNHTAAPVAPRIRLRLKSNRPSKLRVCEKCGGSFRGRSNRQRFCEHCQKAAYRDTARGWDRQNRKGQDWDVSIREIEAA